MRFLEVYKVGLRGGDNLFHSASISCRPVTFSNWEQKELTRSQIWRMGGKGQQFVAWFDQFALGGGMMVMLEEHFFLPKWGLFSAVRHRVRPAIWIIGPWDYFTVLPGSRCRSHHANPRNSNYLSDQWDAFSEPFSEHSLRSSVSTFPWPLMCTSGFLLRRPLRNETKTLSNTLKKANAAHIAPIAFSWPLLQDMTHHPYLEYEYSYRIGYFA